MYISDNEPFSRISTKKKNLLGYLKVSLSTRHSRQKIQFQIQRIHFKTIKMNKQTDRILTDRIYRVFLDEDSFINLKSSHPVTELCIKGVQ